MNSKPPAQKMIDDDEEYRPEDQQENIDDIDLRDDWYIGPALWSTDWTIETIVRQLTRGNINLNPKFQRRNAWEIKRKSLFIESLILGVPIPQLILAEEKGKKGSFIVIDGKQRLLSLRQFTASKSDEKFEQLKLANLSVRSDLNGLAYDDIASNLLMTADRDSFDNQTIRTVVIRGWRDERYLYSVFLRINTNSVQLSPQELRQALHPGPFTDFIDDVSVREDGVKKILKLKTPDFRMRDIELALRYYAYKHFIYRYDGNLKKFLDDTTLELNRNWESIKTQLENDAVELGMAIDCTISIFGERDQFRKWNGDRFEKRINRAVFDVMAYYFSDPEIRYLALQKHDKIKSAFISLCERDQEFLDSISQTTKSISANRIRFERWGNTLSESIDRTVTSPFNHDAQ